LVLTVDDYYELSLRFGATPEPDSTD